jgi:hypothetical protein
VPSTENQSLPEEINSVSASIVNQQVRWKKWHKNKSDSPMFPQKIIWQKMLKNNSHYDNHKFYR